MKAAFWKRGLTTALCVAASLSAAPSFAAPSKAQMRASIAMD